MKLIVDIPNEIYKKYMDDRTHATDVLHAVRHGTILPKHHGDLIDRDELLIESEWYGERATYSNPIPNGETAVPEEVVLNAPTIIEGSESE